MSPMLLADSDATALMTQAVAAISGVTVVVLGALKGFREWLDAEAKRRESVNVVPSKGIETKLEVLITKVEHLDTSYRQTDAKVDSLIERIVRLEAYAEHAG